MEDFNTLPSYLAEALNADPSVRALLERERIEQVIDQAMRIHLREQQAAEWAALERRHSEAVRSIEETFIALKARIMVRLRM